MEILNDYSQNRRVIYLMYDGEREYVVTTGGPQGSVLVSLL